VFIADLNHFIRQLAFDPGVYFLIFGLVLYFKRNQLSARKLKIYLSVYLVLLYFTLAPFFTDYFIYQWERKFPAFELSNFPKNAAPKIVILGSGYEQDETLPKTALLGKSALSRLVEAVRIANYFENATLHTSGYSASGRTPGAIVLKDAAIELGISGERITVQSKPHNTKAEAIEFYNNFYNQRDTIILVTSASHISRASKHFKSVGVKTLIVAPSDYQSFWETSRWYLLLIPRFSNWRKLGAFIKERTGEFFSL
jgi:uncharacterized SAM-binding protein YcdF (DUF218 family)